MKKIIFLLIFSATVAFCENLAFSGATDKNPVLYNVNEPMIFTIKLVDRDKGYATVDNVPLEWEWCADDGKQESGRAISSSSKDLTIRASISKPGFVRLNVYMIDAATGERNKEEGHYFQGGAGACVNEIPQCDEPEDFDAFWDDIKSKLFAELPEVKLTKVESDSTNEYTVWQYKIDTLPGKTPATGIIGYANDAKPGSLKMFITPSAYGFGRYNLPTEKMKKGYICISPTRWGENPVGGKEYYAWQQKNYDGKYGFRNLDQKTENDLFLILLRDLRGVQYAMSLPVWNGRDMEIHGGSMGAFQATALAGMLPATKLVIHIPWVCDLQGKDAYGRMRGWMPEYTPEIAYCDTTFFAKRVSCSTELEIGLGDYICPPSGTILLFRNLKGKKKLTIVQNFGHGSSFGAHSVRYYFEGKIPNQPKPMAIP